MNRIDALKILEEEGLKYYNWFGEHKVRANEVIIDRKDAQWGVCVSDERACIVETSYSFFDTEEDAIDRFIKLVRFEKRYHYLDRKYYLLLQN